VVGGFSGRNGVHDGGWSLPALSGRMYFCDCKQWLVRHRSDIASRFDLYELGHAVPLCAVPDMRPTMYLFRAVFPKTALTLDSAFAVQWWASILLCLARHCRLNREWTRVQNGCTFKVLNSGCDYVVGTLVV